MTDQDRKDLQEFRELYAELSERGKDNINNELFNAMLNRSKQPRAIFTALAAMGGQIEDHEYHHSVLFGREMEGRSLDVVCRSAMRREKEMHD